jgi:small subunit ribosomal protein S16
MGAKQAACYRIVVSDSRLTPSGRFVDVLGTYDPGQDPASIKVDVARAEEWIAKGAHASATVRSLIGKAKKAEPAAQA